MENTMILFSQFENTNCEFCSVCGIGKIKSQNIFFLQFTQWEDMTAEEFRKDKKRCVDAFIKEGYTIQEERTECKEGYKNNVDTIIFHCPDGVTHLPLSLTYTGPAIDVLAQARANGQVDPLSKVIKINGVDILSPKSAVNIGVGTAKIMRYAVTAFTKLNHQNTTGEKLKLRVFLDLNDYAQANGVDITSSSAMKNFRHKIKLDLEKLKQAGATFTEKVKGKPTRYAGLNYIGQYDIKGDTIMIEFTLGMAEYLVTRPLMSYPRSLYSLDDRDANAFAIGEAMCRHYSIDSNVLRGTHGRLRVETLLQCTSFPTYDELQAQKSGWESNVKERFEKCLDRLYQCGFIKDWGYDTETAEISSYREFINTILWYELNDFDDTTTRAKAIAEKRTEKMKKLTQSRQNNRQKKENVDNN